jgi:hypothetical protein
MADKSLLKKMLHIEDDLDFDNLMNSLGLKSGDKVDL